MEVQQRSLSDHRYVTLVFLLPYDKTIGKVNKVLNQIKIIVLT